MFDSLAPDAAHLATLTAKLAADAGADLDVGYQIIDSPVGPLLLAATTRGLVRIAFEREGFDAVRESLSERIGPRLLPRRDSVRETESQLAQYFSGDRKVFSIVIDELLTGGFRAEVQQKLTQIPFGQTASYAELARLVGRPTAVRATASACATNPLPIVRPCHRIVRSDGTPGGYLGGAEAKEMLLSLERTS